MKTIYVDVLIVLNIYVNFFLLRGTARLTHTPLRTIRCVAASVTGSLFSLTIFLPATGMLIPLLIKFAAAVFIVFIAFGIGSLKRFIKTTGYFYIVNFIFGGIVMLFYQLFRPEFMAFSNTYFYVDFSLISLIVFTAAAYFIVSGFRYMMDRGKEQHGNYRVIVKSRGKVISADAVADTGNSLVDPFSGKPVVIIRGEDFKEITDCGCEITDENAQMLFERYSLRFIPYSTIDGTGMIAVFSPDETVILNCETGQSKSVDVMIGVNRRDVPAIFNPVLLC